VFVSSHLLSEMSQMADNVVVIGKGKLIASTTVDEFVNKSTHSGVYVRTRELTKLEKALHKAGLKFESKEDGLLVTGETTDTIGSVAFEAKLPVLELSRHTASLEEAFLEMTGSSQEFSTGQTSRKWWRRG
jgi:ABC-2 type transport system ATP-binding protein